MYRCEAEQPWVAGEVSGPARGSVFIVWKKSCHRSTMTARCFGARIWFISPLTGTSVWRNVARYAISFFLTLWLLAVHRPKLVIVLNQPLPLLIAVRIYSSLSGSRYILDCHSNAYAHDRSRIAMSVYGSLTRSAQFNINHNREDARRVQMMGGTSYLIPEIPGTLGPSDEGAVDLIRPNAIVVCSFTKDEPIELLLQAAALRPDITFYFTGNYKKAGESLISRHPPNVILLGFVSSEKYLQYLMNAMAVVTLSTRKHIMQMAAEEAMCLGVPLVTNESPILEEVFGDAAIYVDLDAARVAAAIADATAKHDFYRARMLARRDLRRDNLRHTLETIRLAHLS